MKSCIGLIFLCLGIAIEVECLERCFDRPGKPCFVGYAIHKENDFTEEVDFQCKNGETVQYLSSYHDGGPEDRVFYRRCFPTKLNLGTSFMSPYINGYTGSMDYRCPDKHVVTGIYAVYNSDKKDRKFKLRCTSISTSQKNPECKWSLYTKHDKPWQLMVPLNNYIAGMRGTFHGRHKDRMYSFYFCKNT